MKYEGQLYGKIGRRYIPLRGTTEEWDKMKEPWIKLSEQKPEEEGGYLVCAPSDRYPEIFNMEIGYWRNYPNGSEFFDFIATWCDRVTHWMPLPEGPKE